MYFNTSMLGNEYTSGNSGLCCFMWWRGTSLVPCLQLNSASFKMTSSNENIFSVTGLLCGKFTGHWWIPHTRSLDVVFDLRMDQQWSKQSRRRWFETPSRALWRRCNVVDLLSRYLYSGFPIFPWSHMTTFGSGVGQTISWQYMTCDFVIA